MEKIETKQNWTKDYFGNYLVVSNGIVIFGMVTVPESGIYIMETQVTQELYQTVVGNNPSHHKGEKHPVENVRMNDVKAFIKELNDLTNLSFILPTAKEWTKASNRKSSYKYADSDDLDSIAWYGENSNGYTHPVKQKRPNRLGLYDMCGNVYEWTSSETYRGALSLAQMTMPALKDKQPQVCYIIKGGSYRNAASVCETWSNSINRYSNYKGWEVGFRLVLDIEPMKNDISDE